jgi:hypothetical protein
MALGVEGMPAAKVVRKVVYLVVGTALLAACLTLLFLSMRSVMEIGGSCASGGPYVVGRTCPDGTWLAPVSIWVGIGACVLMVIGAFPGAGPQPVVFAWPALFLSLGWNFWEYGLNPPGDPASFTVWGWILCGVIFVVMGGLPLIPIAGNLRGVLWGGTPPPAVPVAVNRLRRTGRERSTVSTWERQGEIRTIVVGAPSASTLDDPDDPDDDRDDREDEHVVTRLERLATLYRRGDLTVEEYQAAKAAVLDQDAGSP